MNLSDVVADLSRFGDDETIYVASRSGDSAAVVGRETDEGDPPESAVGMGYLLEISLARDAVRVWSEWRDRRQPTAEEMVEAILYYSEHDAFLPVV